MAAAGVQHGAAPPGAWAWGGDAGQWELFDDLSSATIDQAFLRRQPSVDLQVTQPRRVATYRIDFNSMIQTNLATGFTRALRRFLGKTMTHNFHPRMVDGSSPSHPTCCLSVQLKGDPSIRYRNGSLTLGLVTKASIPISVPSST